MGSPSLLYQIFQTQELTRVSCIAGRSLATREALAHRLNKMGSGIMTASQPWQDLPSSALAGVGGAAEIPWGHMAGGTVGKGRGIRNTLLA